MADLAHAPEPGVDLKVRAGQGGADDDNGPGFIDSETVATFTGYLRDGILRFPDWLMDSADAALEAADLAELTTLFQHELASTFLDGAETILLRRVAALYRALKVTVENYKGGSSPLGGIVTPEAIQLLITRDELEKTIDRQIARHGDKVPPEVIRQLVLVSPAQLADMSSITENQWGVWRHRGVGPKYLKPSRKMIRYPATAVMEWIDDILPDASDNT